MRHPTTDLYFFDSCHPYIAHWWRDRPVRAIGPNCFVAGDTMLLIRRDHPRIMRRALDWQHKLIYLVDDDIDGALESDGLPDDYRQRLAIFAEEFHTPLLCRADHIMAPSATLEERLSIHAPVTRIDPFWFVPPADGSHFAYASQQFRIAHLGTASHKGGLAQIAPTLRAIVGRHDHVEVTYVGRPGDHPILENHPRLHRISPMRWPRYRRWLSRQRYHLCVYPLTDTRFDRARSANKLAEHAVVGAAGLYPDDWALADRLANAALRTSRDHRAWDAAIEHAIRAPERLRTIAHNATRSLSTFFQPTVQRDLWKHHLRIS